MRCVIRSSAVVLSVGLTRRVAKNQAETGMVCGDTR